MAPNLSALVGINPSPGMIANKTADVLAVQRLLNRVACTPRVPEDGKVSDALIAAINDFQTSWTTPDGRVDVGGATWQRLVYLASPCLTIKHVGTKRIEHGGYDISYGPAFSWTQHYRTFLTLHNAVLSPGANLRRLGELPFLLEITGRNPHDVLDYALLPKFLYAIESLGDSVWGSVRHCAIYIARGETIVARSINAVPLTCPIKPLCDKPALVMPEALPYCDEADAPLVTPTPINDEYWFRTAGTFATKRATRGFNCCTYPAAVFGLTSGTASGSQLADKIAPAATNSVSAGSYSTTMSFLTKNRSGRYLLWYDYQSAKHGPAGHVVLVVDGVAHEWSESHKGYKQTTIPSGYDVNSPCLWGSKANGKYWVRRLD